MCRIPPKPQPGDVLIVKTTHSAPTFDVGTDLDHLQLRFETCEEATRQAETAARRASVDPWKSEDGLSFESVARKRPR